MTCRDCVNDNICSYSLRHIEVNVEKSCFGFKFKNKSDFQPVLHGQWEFAGEDINGIPFYSCSLCGYELRTEDGLVTRFCPNCGEKMAKIDL